MFETFYFGDGADGDKLFNFMAENLKTELNGYTFMAEFRQEGIFKGCAALKYEDGYCAIDIYAPEVKFTRKCLKDFFDRIFANAPVCLCVIRNTNEKSREFVSRLGFREAGSIDGETLFKYTEEDFKKRFYGGGNENKSNKAG